MNKKIILNHKSYLNYDEIIQYKKALEKLKVNNFDIILFPSIIYLSLFKDTKIKVGTQNFYKYDYGSFTGEINLKLLEYINIRYTLVGHSERIRFKLDTKKDIKNKLQESLNYNFNTILSIGEFSKKNNVFATLKSQLNYYLKNLDFSKLKLLSIAYEPAWAIESDNSLPVKNIDEIVNKIKSYFQKKYNFNIEVYYGGSVKEDSIKEILQATDGVLIGKLSTDIKKIENIIDKLA